MQTHPVFILSNVFKTTIQFRNFTIKYESEKEIRGLLTVDGGLKNFHNLPPIPNIYFTTVTWLQNQKIEMSLV